MSNFEEGKETFAKHIISRLSRRTFIKELSCATALPILFHPLISRAHEIGVLEVGDEPQPQHEEELRELFIDVDARLIFRHTGEKPSTESVTGKIKTIPALGRYEVSLATASGTPFAFLTGLICIAVIIIVILDWPRPANAKERARRRRLGLAQPVNFLDITNGEYSGRAEVNFEEGSVKKRFNVRRVDPTHFTAKVMTIHQYPRALSANLVQLLPNDIAIVDNGPGKACGRSQIRWLTSEGSILVGDMLIDFQFKNEKARIPFPEVFSYKYNISDLSSLPLTIESVGVMRGVC